MNILLISQWNVCCGYLDIQSVSWRYFEWVPTTYIFMEKWEQYQSSPQPLYNTIAGIQNKNYER